MRRALTVGPVEGLAMFVATNHEPHPEGGLTSRDNVFAVDLAALRTIRLTSDELAHGVAVAGRRLFLTTSGSEGSELYEIITGRCDIVGELGPVKANEVVASGDRLVWTDAGDRPIEWLRFETPCLRAWTVGTAEMSTLIDGKKTLRGPSFGPGGDISVLEMPRANARAPQC